MVEIYLFIKSIMPRRRPLKLKPLTASKSIIPSLSEDDRNLLTRAQTLLKQTDIEKVRTIYSFLEDRELQDGLQVSFDIEDVSKKDLPMKMMLGGIGTVSSIEVPKLNRDVVKIHNVTVEQDGEVRYPQFSDYFYKSSGTSRALSGIKDIWLPCGNVPLKEDLPNIRYSKLEDEILTKINLILNNFERINEQEYQTKFAMFLDEFPTWEQLLESILIYGRFITQTNALISYKLYGLHQDRNHTSVAVAEGIKGFVKGKSPKKKKSYKKTKLNQKKKSTKKVKLNHKRKKKPKSQKKNKK